MSSFPEVLLKFKFIQTTTFVMVYNDARYVAWALYSKQLPTHCQAVAKVFLGHSQLVHIKGDLHQVSLFRHAAKKIYFFGSLNSNKIQVRWCLHACFDSFPLSLPYSELCHSLCSVQWTSKGSFTSSWSMLTPSCFLKTVGFVLTLYIIIITDTLDIHNTAWNRFDHLIVRSVLKMVFENQL